MPATARVPRHTCTMAAEHSSVATVAAAAAAASDSDPTASAFQNRRQTLASNFNFVVALVPVGDLPRAKFCEYAALFRKFTSLRMHSLTPPGNWEAGVLRFHSWQEGALRFTFLVDPPPPRIEWENFQVRQAAVVVRGGGAPERGLRRSRGHLWWWHAVVARTSALAPTCVTRCACDVPGACRRTCPCSL